MDQKFWKSLAGQFSFGVSHVVGWEVGGAKAIKALPGLDIQDGSLLGLAFDTGCQLGSQLPCQPMQHLCKVSWAWPWLLHSIEA